MGVAAVLPKPAAVADDAVVAVSDGGECALAASGVGEHPAYSGIG